jgi:hypothetical protein
LPLILGMIVLLLQSQCPSYKGSKGEIIWLGLGPHSSKINNFPGGLSLIGTSFILIILHFTDKHSHIQSDIGHPAWGIKCHEGHSNPRSGRAAHLREAWHKDHYGCPHIKQNLHTHTLLYSLETHRHCLWISDCSDVRGYVKSDHTS